MSHNDPFFDAWVRDKLRHAEARTPDHLWDAIRRGSLYYIVVDRNKYFLVLLLLLLTTGGIAYWGFHASAPRGGEAGKNAAVGARGADVAASGRSAAGTGIADASRTGVAAPAVTPPPDANVASQAEPLTAVSLASGVSAATFPGPTLETRQSAETDAAANRPLEADPAASLQPQTRQGSLTLSGKGEDLSIPFRTGALAPKQTTASLATAPLVHLRERRHTYIECYAGADHVNHYITASSPAYASYVQQAKSMEMSYPSFSVGLRLDLPLWTDRWRFQTGVHYAQINEHLHYFNPSYTKTVFQVTTRSVVGPSGNVVQVMDTTSVTYKGQYLKQSLNAYRRIDIPVVLSYTLVHTPQFELGGSGGAFFNVVSWYGGDIVDTTGLPTALHSGHGQGVSNWKKQMGASLYGSLSLRDQLSSRVRVSLEPYLRYDLNTINKDVNVYKERFVATGLSLGLQYAIGH
ncbi:hypothetical protein [Dinghuibacter silviterrae]|uniref:Uncharacterized protein n=1 Tax=Dinghuibacter silviterrae TaxID=1539049 RepID=A0A4R8DSK5_9BACT|nr:hypothetical protein [Dinghuibacter silviterrae]TDX01039.1 hypothetical protein EDB95_2070 [Dinghuibacter silviterrae]